MIRSNITGTTHRPCVVAVDELQRRFGVELAAVTTVQAIDAANNRCEKPQAWNIGATTTTVLSVRHGTRSNDGAHLVESATGISLAPLGVPVVPEVSRIQFAL